MFTKISMAVLCLISSTQAADVATTVQQDFAAAGQAASSAGAVAAADIRIAEDQAKAFANGSYNLPTPPSVIKVPNFASPQAQQLERRLSRQLGRFAQEQGDISGRALEPSLKALDQASQSARVRTAGAMAQILRPATQAFALFVDKMGPGKQCNVPKFYDCWMGKQQFERDQFLLQGECAQKSGCNVREDKNAMAQVGQTANKVGGILQQLDQQIQQEFQAASEAAAKVVQKESETWVKGVLDIFSENFNCDNGCIRRAFKRLGPNSNPGMIADKCSCQPPFATNQTVQELIGMTTRDFYLTSAEEYVSMADEPNPDVLEEDLDDLEEDEEMLDLFDAEQAAKDAAAAGAAAGAKAAADAAAKGGNDAAAEQIKNAAAAAGTPVASTDAAATPAASTDAAATPAAGATATKSTSQKIKDAAKSNPTVTIVIIVVVVLLLVGIALFFYFRSSGKEETTEEGGNVEVADLYRRLM